jgi:alanyl-tRNA synthetase
MGMERTPDGQLRDLPRRNIDTGAGLERILPIVEGVENMFATDLFVPLLDSAQSLTGVRYGEDERSTRSLRVMADHARAMVCLIADGVTPSNEGRGNVLRRVIRRSVLRAFQLGAVHQVCRELGEVAIDSLSSAMPRLDASRDSILETIDREETTFRRTLERGNALLEQELSSGRGISGHSAFTLHDTYGFPIELTAEIADSEGVSIDMEGFTKEMEAQKTRARRAFSAGKATLEHGSRNDTYTKVLEDSGPTEFLGYELEESGATVLAVMPTGESGEYEIILDMTPFYAESGGQLGDTGQFVLTAAVGRDKQPQNPPPFVTVLDTQSAPGGIITHRVTIPADLRAESGSSGGDSMQFESGIFIHPGDEIYARVNHERRAALRRNHTATHLLHAALRQVLGDHVHQQGSLVAPDRLRFDFSHHSHIRPEELESILEMANSDVVSDSAVSTMVTDRAQAESMGALAFFGDRYGNEVRVVKAGGHSTELCGGTHVAALGQIGPILVVSESSIGSNTRRLEAITGLDSIHFLIERSRLVESAARAINVEPEQILHGVERLLEQKQHTDKELERRKMESLEITASDLARGADTGTVVARVDGFSNDDLRDLATKVRDRGVKVVILAGSPDGTKVAIAIATDGSRNAGEMIKVLAGIVKGGGGGSPQMAMAGGKDVTGIDELIHRALALVGNGAT